MSGSRPWRQQLKPRITPDDAKFAEFTGVVNTRSRKDIGLKALYAGDNVVISDTKKIVRRSGYSTYLNSGAISAAYGGTGDLYVIDGGVLKRVLSPTDQRTLAAGFSSQPCTWDTINGDAYFVNGVDAGIARGDTYLPWRLDVPTVSGVSADAAGSGSGAYGMGASYTEALFRLCATYETEDGRETAPSDVVELRASPVTTIIRAAVSSGYARTNLYCTPADDPVFRLVATGSGALTFNPQRGGRTLTTLGTSSLPEGVTHVAFCKGQCFAGRYLPYARMSAVWVSQPLGFHLWNRSKDFLPVSGELALLLWNNKGVLIGTTQAVYQYNDVSGELEQLANYGVLPGIAGDTDAEGMAYFWTQRGICKAYPFENLTEKDVSMPTGTRAVAAMVYLNGMQQFIAVAQGDGVSFNPRKERT